METNKNLLKEAIADAQAVKETAIANARAAIEETFTPRLKELFASKITEIEAEEETKEVKEEMEVDAEEELNLDELLAELSDDEGETETETETDDSESTETAEEDEVEISDMSEEDLKTFIEDVIKDMVASGELGDEGGSEEIVATDDTAADVVSDDTAIEDEEEVNIDELISEVEEMEKDELKEGKGIGILKGIGAMLNPFKQPADFVKEMGKKMKENPDLANDEEFMTMYNMLKGVAGVVSGASGGFPGKEAKRRSAYESTTNESDSKELEEAHSTIQTLKKEINEVNLLNAKLLYVNKLFKSKNLSDSQKVKIVENFDKATTVKEVKLIYETLNEAIDKKVKINESKSPKGFASKSISVVKEKQPIIESNAAFERMRRLAGL